MYLIYLNIGDDQGAVHITCSCAFSQAQIRSDKKRALEMVQKGRSTGLLTIYGTALMHTAAIAN